MSDRAREFLIHWFSGNVEALPPALRLAAAVRLATECRKDAVMAGIPPHEIRSAVGGDLIRKILEALNAAARLNNEAPLAPEMDAFVEAAADEAN
jgi:hypothetical protein